MAILSECGDELGMHRQFLSLGANSASRAEILLSCMAGCSGVSGRGYYATEPVLDVQDVPAEGKPSFSSERIEMTNGKLASARERGKFSRKLAKAVCLPTSPG